MFSANSVVDKVCDPMTFLLRVFSVICFQKIFVLRLSYNLGSGIQILQEPNVDLVDGMFHVIRVIRNKAHLQLQVDSEEVLESTSNGTWSAEISSAFLVSLIVHKLNQCLMEFQPSSRVISAVNLEVF